MKATELLKKQHRSVHALFGELKKLKGASRRKVMDQIGAELAHHMAIEEDVFYPAVCELDTKRTKEMIAEAFEEHHVLRLVLAEIPRVDPDDERFEAKMTVLAEIVKHHVEEEETEMFKAAAKLGDDRLRALGEEMESGGEQRLRSRTRQDAHQHDRREVRMQPMSNQRGAAGWALLWLLGIPIPILVVLFVMRGCT